MSRINRVTGRLFSFFMVLGCCLQMAVAQVVEPAGEIGIGLGGAHYFGDLNNRFRVNRPKLYGSLFYRHFINPYVAIRGSVSVAQLGYADVYNKARDFEYVRNLSFNTHVLEGAIQGDFNFMSFVPGSRDAIFTPYVTLGVGVFSFNPYALLEGEKYFLQPLGTEGQGSAAFPDRQPYKLSAISFPLGFGFKYNITGNWVLGLEFVNRFTGTDYLDDVSTTYAGPDQFPPQGGQPSVAFRLQDRSDAYGIPIGVKGRQRGISLRKDQFMHAALTISYGFTRYKCPSAR